MRTRLVKKVSLVKLGLKFQNKMNLLTSLASATATFFFLFCLFISCSSRPEKIIPPSHVEIPQDVPLNSEQPSPTHSDAIPSEPKSDSESQAPSSPHEDKASIARSAIWFTTSNLMTGGTLGRLDLKTGALNTQVRTVARDSIVIQDGFNDLFLLRRMGSDSLTLLSDSKAQVSAHRTLVNYSNPQFVARDSLQRIWVTFLDSNQVKVFSPHLTEEIGQVDLSSLAVNGSLSSFASFGEVALIDHQNMAVTALRLHRKSNAWQPDQRSGLAIIDTQSLQPIHLDFLNIPNPVRIYAKKQELYILGAGDLSPLNGVFGSFGKFILSNKTSSIIENYSFTVLDAHISSVNHPAALIAWYKNEDRTCVQLGAKKIHCENGGYAFNKILQVSNYLYLSYSGSSNAELWIMAIDHSLIRKFPVNLPIQSMCFGP